MANEDGGNPKPGRLRLVAEADEATRLILETERRDRVQSDARRFAALGLQYPLLNLASNILRIVRGAGKPGQLAADCAELLEAFAKYEIAFGHFPGPQQIHDGLCFQIEIRGPAEYHEYLYAMEQITRGSLQFVASNLLGQMPQMRSGESEMCQGARRYEKYLEAERARYQRVALPAKKAKSRKPKSTKI